MNEMHLISVIIPAFNAENFIAKTIISVLSQTYTNLDVIVVDDGSQDNTFQVVNEFVRQDSRIKLCKQKNLGVAAARNYAISQARGNFIAPIDADDIWYPEKLSKQLRCLDNSKDSVGLVYTWSIFIDEKGDFTGGANISNWEGNVFLPMAYRNFIGHASGPLIRKSCLEKVGNYNVNLKELGAQGCEDRDLYLRIARHYEFRVIPEFLVGYRLTNNSMSCNDISMAKSHHLIWDDLLSKDINIDRKIYNYSTSNFYIYLSQKNKIKHNSYKSLDWLIQSLKLDLAVLVRHEFYSIILANIRQLLLESVFNTLSFRNSSDYQMNSRNKKLTKKETIDSIHKTTELREYLPWKIIERYRLNSWSK